MILPSPPALNVNLTNVPDVFPFTGLDSVAVTSSASLSIPSLTNADASNELITVSPAPRRRTFWSL